MKSTSRLSGVRTLLLGSLAFVLTVTALNWIAKSLLVGIVISPYEHVSPSNRPLQ